MSNRISRPSKQPTSSPPVIANFSSDKLVIGAGVALFHLATDRVVVCYHTRDKYWFLPKGRRNESESSRRAAIREGFEESGYRGRLVPLPIAHRQPPPEEQGYRAPFVVEPVWTQLVPQSATAQYMLFWFVGETVPEAVEEALNRDGGDVFVDPPEFGADMTFVERAAVDRKVDGEGKEVIHEPRRHDGTGVDEEERMYTSQLLSVDEARRKLRGSLQDDVVRRGYEAIKLRRLIEEEAAKPETK